MYEGYVEDKTSQDEQEGVEKLDSRLFYNRRYHQIHRHYNHNDRNGQRNL